MDFDPGENKKAWRLMYNYNTTAKFGEWGFVEFPKWNNGFEGDPTVLFVRQDKKDVTNYQIEALSSYINEVALWKLVDESYYFTQKQKTVPVKRYLTAEAFDAYFARYANARYERGKKEWGRKEGQNSGREISTFDLLRGT